jgi:hypothetical protein
VHAKVRQLLLARSADSTCKDKTEKEGLPGLEIDDALKVDSTFWPSALQLK